MAGEVANFLFYYPKRSQLDLRNFVAPQIAKSPLTLLFETDILMVVRLMALRRKLKWETCVEHIRYGCAMHDLITQKVPKQP